MTVRQPFEFTRAIAANGETVISVQGQFMAILETTGELEFTFDDGAFTRGRAGVQYALPGTETYRQIKFRDVSGGANSVTLLTAFAEIRDQRLTVSGIVDVLAQLPGGGVAAVTNLAAGASVQIGGHATQRSFVITNADPTSPVHMGNGASATAGAVLGPGETMHLDITSAIGVFNPSGHTIALRWMSMR